jgi:hypothetical protein
MKRIQLHLIILIMMVLTSVSVRNIYANTPYTEFFQALTVLNKTASETLVLVCQQITWYYLLKKYSECNEDCSTNKFQVK